MNERPDMELEKAYLRPVGYSIVMMFAVLGINSLVLSTGKYDKYVTSVVDGEEITEIVPATGEFSWPDFIDAVELFLLAEALFYFIRKYLR